MNWMKIFALVLFVLMYVFIIAKPKYRPFYALTVAVIFLVSGILPLDRLAETINWNVLLMMAGTMIIVYFSAVLILCTHSPLKQKRQHVLIHFDKNE